MNIKMKTALFLLILIFSRFGTIDVLAQKKIKQKEVIIVELTVTSRAQSAQIIEVPINVSVARGEEKPLKAGWEKKGDGTLPPQYSFNLEAYFKDKNSSDVYLEIIVEGCEEIVRKHFIVSKTQKTELGIGCETGIVAYYSTESKKKSSLIKNN